jgi:hypothetical protein
LQPFSFLQSNVRVGVGRKKRVVKVRTRSFVSFGLEVIVGWRFGAGPRVRGSRGRLRAGFYF